MNGEMTQLIGKCRLFWCLIGILAGLNACGIHYYDPETGADHLWGFGHLSMKAQTLPENQAALVKGLETFGVVVGNSQDDSYFQTGWSRRQRIELLQPDALLQLDGPQADFMNLRIGGQPAFSKSSNSGGKP